MADERDLNEVFRRAVQANVKFYQGWLDLSVAYVKGLSEIFTDSDGGTDRVESGPATPDVSVLVFEAEAGTTAQSAFLVTNDLSRKVSCQLVASQFSGSDGKTARPKVTFDPKAFDLKPGEQRVVQAEVGISKSLTAGHGYQGQFAIKGMEGVAVPVVVRRRHRPDEIPSIPVEKAESAGAAASGKASRPKSSPPKASPKKTAAKKAAPKSKTEAKAKAPRKRAARQKS